MYLLHREYTMFLSPILFLFLPSYEARRASVLESAASRFHCLFLCKNV